MVGPLTQRAVRTEDWKLILSEGGPHELYNLADDPEEILNLYGVPYEDEHDQYRHFPPHDGTIYELARRLESEARKLGDATGIALARSVLDNPIRRHDWQQGTAKAVRI